jgi:hypothetical protein
MPFIENFHLFSEEKYFINNQDEKDQVVVNKNW